MLTAFIFYACTSTIPNTAECIAPVRVESEAACKQMERDFIATLDAMRTGTEVKTRCAPVLVETAPPRP
jgi:hypothetical protein